MKHSRQPGLFDVEERAAQLAKMDDLLVGLDARIDWKAFRPDLSRRVHEEDRKVRRESQAIRCCADTQSTDPSATAQSVG